MIRRFLKRSTAITLVVSLMSSTLSFCLSGCDSKNNISNDELYSLTYTDTELEKRSKELTDIYENLSDALTVGGSLDIKKNLLSLKDALRGFIDDFTNYTDNIDKKISKQDQVIKDRQSEFEATIKDNAESLDSSIQYLIDNSNNINSSKCRENIQNISKCFSNNDFSVTGNDFENGVSENVEPETQDIPIGIDSYISKSAEAVSSSKPSESSLVLTDETQLTDEIKKLADELATPLNVYLYIRNNINTDFYSGSRKGAVATFESRSGNDVDQASLLIAMLRYLGYPAQYVTGKVFISAEQALKLTLASDIATAGTILVSSGKEVTSLTEGGKVVGFLIEETWVESYLPYTDYRGAGNNSGAEKWIPLDTSVKEYEKLEGFYDNLEEYGLPEDIFEQPLSESDIDDLYNKLSAIEKEHEGEEIVLNTKQIIQEDLIYLPLTLQYTVKEVTDEYDQIEQSRSDSIVFTINGQTITSLKSLDI